MSAKGMLKVGTYPLLAVPAIVVATLLIAYYLAYMPLRSVVEMRDERIELQKRVIEEKQGNIKALERNFENARATIEQKEAEIDQLEAEISKMREHPGALMHE